MNVIMLFLVPCYLKKNEKFAVPISECKFTANFSKIFFFEYFLKKLLSSSYSAGNFQYSLGPKMSVPMRTIVEPWSTAIFQSWLMPMLISLNSG